VFRWTIIDENVDSGISDFSSVCPTIGGTSGGRIGRSMADGGWLIKQIYFLSL